MYREREYDQLHELELAAAAAAAAAASYQNNE